MKEVRRTGLHETSVCVCVCVSGINVVIIPEFTSVKSIIGLPFLGHI